MRRPSRTEMYAEMAALARAFHWSPDTVLSLEHAERRRWLASFREPA